MERQDRLLLFLLLGLFSTLLLVLGWSFFYDASNRFLAGTESAITPVEATLPSLPPLRSTDPVTGSTDPRAITITVFSDFTCVSCKLSEQEMIRAVTAFKHPIRVIWRDLPISSTSRDAMLGALAGRCAHAQGKFWELHDIFFASKKRLDEPSIHDLVGKANLDEQAFNACFTKSLALGAIQQDVALAHQSLIVSTPTFFVGNEPAVTGYVSANQFKRLLTNAGARK